jgi:hypothetical protein
MIIDGVMTVEEVVIKEFIKDVETDEEIKEAIDQVVELFMESVGSTGDKEGFEFEGAVSKSCDIFHIRLRRMEEDKWIANIATVDGTPAGDEEEEWIIPSIESAQSAVREALKVGVEVKNTFIHCLADMWQKKFKRYITKKELATKPVGIDMKELLYYKSRIVVVRK